MMTMFTHVRTPSIDNTMLIWWCKICRAWGKNDMGLPLWNMKFHIFQNGRKSISQNIMYFVFSSTTCVANKVDPHRIQRLATIVMWHPKDIMRKTQPNVQCNGKKEWLGKLTTKRSHLVLHTTSSQSEGKLERMLVKEWYYNISKIFSWKWSMFLLSNCSKKGHMLQPIGE
jgi:hypothetical protein